MKKIFAALCASALVMPGVAHAGATPGYVSNLFTVLDDHSYLFDQYGQRDAIPGCGSGLTLRWAVDPTTPFGQAVVATLLTAYALHKQVQIAGTGDCSVHPDTESVKYLVMLN